MNTELSNINPDVVELVADATEKLAKRLGYQTWPRYEGVRLVLEAAIIVNKANELAMGGKKDA